MPAGGPFGGGPPPEPKGNLRPLLDLIGLDWPTTEIVWNPYNPHPQLADLPPEVVFIGKGSGAADAFNPKQIATSGLQEIVTIFPGLLRAQDRQARDPSSSRCFAPTTRAARSALERRRPARASWAISGINPDRRHIPTGHELTRWPPASRARHRAEDAADKDEAKKDEAKKEEKPGDRSR